jgi:hypothetical protein
MAMQKMQGIMPMIIPMTLDKTPPSETQEGPLKPSSTPLAAKPNSVGGPEKRTLLDGIITGLFGAPTSEMTDAEGAKVERERDADRDDAYAMARSAYANPGAQWMQPPGKLDGGGDLIKMFMQMLGGGGGSAA